jgi:tetratricopeptide (TPR) repeat protein
LVYGATAWGVSAALPSWGYSSGYSYSNPYYEAAAMPAYDYSQPIVINTYNSPASEASADGGSTVAPAPPATTTTDDAGYELFDKARSSFKQGDYRAALQLDEQAVAQVSSDPVIHEFGALCLFALGQYDRAAPVLNSLLAVAPGMDWATMSSLYDDVDTYTGQLRKLEAYVKGKPEDVAARFVLAYHYLVAGHADDALEELEYVVEKQPADLVAKRMYDALRPVEVADADAAPPPPEAGGAESTADPSEESPSEQTDLVGTWLAERDGSSFHLTITEDGQFQWKAKPKGQSEISLSGNTSASSDMLILESGDQGSMVARVASGGPDEFQFLAADGPPGDPGLTFKRSAG